MALGGRHFSQKNKPLSVAGHYPPSVTVCWHSRCRKSPSLQNIAWSGQNGTGSDLYTLNFLAFEMFVHIHWSTQMAYPL